MATDRQSPQLDLHSISGFKKEQTQLERKTATQRKKLKKTKERLDKVKSTLILTKQQIDLFTQETHRALEAFKDSNWQFSKESCSEISKIKSPNSALLELSNKFLLMLDQKDRSWETFKAICKNFTPLKSLMSNLQPQFLTDEQVNELLNIWKNQQGIQYKLQKYCDGVKIIASWINFAVEYKLKKETLLTVEQKYPKVNII